MLVTVKKGAVVGSLIGTLVSISVCALASEGYYIDRHTGCRVWTPYFQQAATVQWSGGCKAGTAEGAGILTLTYHSAHESGVETRVEGTYVNGRLNGRALVTYDDNSRFEGEVKDGVKNGRGRYTMVGMGYYDGNYRDGKWNGYGELVLYKECGERCRGSSFSKYVGDFVDNKMRGRGIATKANGDSYEGEWSASLPEGLGTLTWDNGTKRYSGKWAAGCSLSPQGTIYSFASTPQDCEKFRDYLTRITR